MTVDSEPGGGEAGVAAGRRVEARRTDPRGILLRAVRGIGGAILPVVAAMYGTGSTALGLAFVLPAIVAFGGIALAAAVVSWYRLTYTTGEEDIRVERGLLSLSARSVPYERIQDVSIERPLLARVFGLASIQFETGGGAKDEIDLRFVTVEEAGRLRALVRERRDGPMERAGDDAEETGMRADAEPAEETIFTMRLPRLLAFGFFEFSLVIFAILLGAAQQFDFLLPFDVWDWERWVALFEGQRDRLGGAGRDGTILAAVAGLVGVACLGVLTGIVRTVAREFDFRLERTSRGFRRRRGLFTRTDVTLPFHRVQAARVDTGLVRYRFGWHGLRLVSLASDQTGSSSHAVAPFARLGEIWPIAREAGLEPPEADTVWSRPVPGPWLWNAVVLGAVLLLIGLVVSWILASLLPVAGAAVAMAIVAIANGVAWRRRRYARDERQVYTRHGNLVPRLTIAPQVKLQSVELTQGPFARWKDYATLHLGLAGGTMALEGLPVSLAREIRADLLERIAEVDFSELMR